MKTENCPNCDVEVGQFHEPGCSVELCPYCGDQFIGCSCVPQPPMDDRMPWTGKWPGVAECREFGWYEGGEEDLKRLRREARWDRGAKRFVLSESGDPTCDHVHLLLADTFRVLIKIVGPEGMTQLAPIGEADWDYEELEAGIEHAFSVVEAMGWSIGQDQRDIARKRLAGFLGTLRACTVGGSAADRCDSALSTTDFWGLIELSRQEGGADAQKSWERLVDHLAGLSVAEIVAFQDCIDRYMTLSDTESVRAAAIAINNHRCDNAFLCFRATLIAQGEAIFRRALQEPASFIASVASIESAEPILYAAAEAYARKTGSDLVEVLENWPPE